MLTAVRGGLHPIKIPLPTNGGFLHSELDDQESSDESPAQVQIFNLQGTVKLHLPLPDIQQSLRVTASPLGHVMHILTKPVLCV